MEEIGIEKARTSLGEIVEQARLGRFHTLITRFGKPSAVVVDVEWYARHLDDDRALAEWRAAIGQLREGRRRTGLQPPDKRVVHHIDGDRTNNDPANLKVTEAPEVER